MKRLHVHVAVENLAQSIKFYSALFASGPSVIKSDYAKWMLEGSTTRGYAKSEKSWVQDPAGVSWETCLAVGQSTTYGEDSASKDAPAAACCEPDLINRDTQISSPV